MSIAINPMPDGLPVATLERLGRVETATVGHFRLAGFMDLRLRPIAQSLVAAGTAVTVRTHGPDSAAIVTALDMLRPGDVLVVDRSGEDRFACFGAVMGAAARQRGAAAIVIDGRASDLPDLRALGLPVWCTGASPLLSRRLDLDGSINGTVVCGGVTVKPGDAILADESGVLVLDPSDIDSVIETALARQEREQLVLARIARGERLFEISGNAPPPFIAAAGRRADPHD